MSLLNTVKKVIHNIGTIPTAFMAQLPRRYHGVDYKLTTASSAVLTASLGFNPELQKKALLGLSALGGAFVVKQTQESIAAAVKMYDDAGKKFAAKAIKLTTKPGFQIILVKDFLEGLTKKELKAVHYHELGHLVNGDLNTNKVGLSLVLEHELAADEYAATHVGKVHMCNALLKLRFNMSVRLKEQLTEEQYNEFLTEAYSENGIMEKRILALQM